MSSSTDFSSVFGGRRRVKMRFRLLFLGTLLLAVLIGAKHAEAAGLF